MKATLDDTSFGQHADACAEWFALAHHGDEAAATRLYQFCVPRIRHWLAMRLPDSMAEELAHDAMVAAFRKHDRFHPGTLFFPWVKTIAWRMAQNQMRDNSRRHERDMAYSDHYELFGKGGGDIDNSRFTALARSLSTLTESQRHLVHLHYWEKQTGQAIADTQGRTRVAVAVNLHRICQRLRHQIKDIEHQAADDLPLSSQKYLFSTPKPSK
jgi:RNA polymerase sigma factor (sigma-70 family)